MEEGGKKHDLLNPESEYPRQRATSEVVPSNTPSIVGEVNHSVINALASHAHALDIMGFEKPLEERELPGNHRILRIQYPLFEQQKLFGTLLQSDLARPISTFPAIRSTEDPNGVVQVLVTSPSSLKHLRKRCLTDGLHLTFSISPPQIPVLQLQGAANALCPELFTAAHLLPETATGGMDQGTDLVAWQIPMSRITLPVVPAPPRLGPCSYLVWDINTDLEALKWPALLDHLAVLAQSPDFRLNFDQHGDLVVIALSEGALGRLSIWGDSLKTMTKQQAHLFLGKGEIEVADQNNFIINGYPSRPELQGFHILGKTAPGIYSTDQILGSVKGSRDERIVSLEKGPSKSGLVELNVRKRVEFHVGGGPDRLIGYETERQQLEEFLREDNETKLIFLEGAAGIGKSRLINEVATKSPNVIKISIDPAGRNIAGFSLLDFADQIAVHLRNHLANQLEDLPPSVAKLLEFAKKTENERLMDVNKYTETIAFYCSRTLEYLEEKLGHLHIFIDDVHHIDRYSDGHLMNLLAEIMEREMSNSKVVLMRRPEERYASFNQDNLKQRISAHQTVSLQNSDGTPKLDFTDKRIAEDYIRYSLPPEIRNNPEDGHPRILGAWAEHLGKIAKTSSEESSLTPFEVTAFLNEVLCDIPGYLQIQTDYIDLTPAGHERMQKIQGPEMVIYYLERMREQLAPDPDTLKLFQVFALIGQKVASEDALIVFMQAAFAFTPTETEWHLKELVNKGYLTSEESINDIEDFAGLSPERHYRIWHENVRDIVLSNTLDQAGKEELADRVYQASQITGMLSENQQFTILHYASGGKSRQDQNFWEDYATWGGKALADAERYNLYGQGYGIASMILRELGMESDKNKAIIQNLTDMMAGKEVGPAIGNFILRSLHALVENGYYLGQFSKVYQAISIAEEIATRGKIGVDMPRFHRFGFLTAYAQINCLKLEYYNTKLSDVPLAEEERRLFALKFAYRQGKFSECHQIMASFPDRENLPNEVKRLKIRIQLEEIINEVTAGGIDGDAVLSGLDLSEQQKEEVMALRQELEKLKRELSSGLGEGEMKTRLNPVDELHLLDMDAQLLALTGQYYQAMRRFGESWRIAMQMEVFQEATRAAKQKGDVAIFKALREKANLKSTLFYRQALRGAVHTYTEEGLHIAERLDDKTWKFYLTVQRLRALCFLLITYDAKESDNLTREIFELLDLASSDIEFINQEPWTQYIPQANSGETPPSAFEVCYYITPLMVYFRGMAEYHDYQKAPAGPLPFEEHKVVEGSTQFALELQEDKMHERFRKTESLFFQLGIK